jgi:hypothetical protein
MDGGMFLILVILAGVAAVPLAGGRLTALAGLRFRRVWTLPAALAVQVVIISIIPDHLQVLHPALHVATYGLTAWFLIANRRVRGMWVIGVGGILNVVAITANGGVMPASAAALHTAGLHLDTGAAFANSAVVTGAHLAFLGDVFAVPASWPLANVYSVGDAVIVLGALYGIHRACASVLVAPIAARSAGRNARHAVARGLEAAPRNW